MDLSSNAPAHILIPSIAKPCSILFAMSAFSSKVNDLPNPASLALIASDIAHRLSVPLT